MKKTKSTKLTELYLDEVKFEDGHQVHYVYFNYPESVAVVPILDNKYIYLIKQYRYAIEQYSWEIPAGGVNEGESIQQAALRELSEETSFDADVVEYLFSFYPSNAMSNEKIHLFMADRFQATEHIRMQELLERGIEVKRFRISEIQKMITNQEITDAATIIGAQYFYS